MFATLRNWLQPPHKCKQFIYFERIYIKRCTECGKRYWLSDGTEIKRKRLDWE